MKQQNKQRYLIRYLTIFAILISIVIVKTSCTKLDVNYQANQVHPSNFVEQFFATKTTPTTAVANLIQKLKDENDRTGFVKNLPKNCGLPIWEKVVFKKSSNHNDDASLYSPAKHGPSANLTEDSTEVDVIPLSITDSALSSLLVVKDDNGTITTNCITTNGDLYNNLHNSAIDSISKVNNLLWFMFMENQTFGTNIFYHIPATILNNGAIIDAQGNRIIQGIQTQTNTGNFGQICWTFCCGVCNGNDPDCPNGGCTTICRDINDDPWPGPGSGGGGGTGTGGTGGTGPGGTGGGPCGTCTPPPPPPNCNDPFYSFGPCGPLPPSQEQLDLQWMNANVIDSTNDPCITSTITTLKQITPKLPRLIREFFTTNPTFKMRFETYVSSQPSCNGSYCEPEGAFTHPVPLNNTYEISINKYYANATDLSSAATIIHEALHAQLIQWLRQAVIQQDTAAQHQLAALYGHVFTPDFNYNANVYNTALQLTTQHDAMVALYKNLVGDALYAFAQQKNISITTQDCQKLAWAGLNNTEAFNRLQISVKDDITERINAERDPNGSTVNSNGNGGTIRIAYGTPCY